MTFVQVVPTFVQVHGIPTFVKVVPMIIQVIQTSVQVVVGTNVCASSINMFFPSGANVHLSGPGGKHEQSDVRD